MKKILLLFLILSTLVFADLTKAKTTYVTDGDTFHVLIDGKKEKIRMFGIDAPESKQEWGLEAKESLNKLISNKEVLLDIKNKDMYGRLLAVVFIGKQNINLEMIKTGNAWYYEYYDKNNKESKTAMENAKKNKLGLWSKPNPKNPFEFRKDK
ncbi:MAG: thermonuclease family protein [Fusobacteriaceae bacterium]|nr:thermonuclease family protein [Fusobacteriaceae bacterium]